MKNSKIILARGIRLDKNYNNVLSYKETDLLNLLRQPEHKIYEASDYSFIDEFQNVINAQVPYGDCIDLNYMAFQNPRYNNKWFFCFIDKVEYNSEKSTNITFHVDSWSTWYEEIRLKNCYVLREHVEDDTIGLHTVDEGLDVGEVICEGVTTDGTLTSATSYVCVATNWDVADKTGFTGVCIMNGVVWGSMLCVFPFTYDGITKLQYFIQQTNTDGHPNDIRDIFIIPSIFLDTQGLLVTKNYDVTIGDQVVAQTSFDRLTILPTGTVFWSAIESDKSITKHYTYTGLSIKNNKCYCYPYNYLLVTNNIGNVNVLKYENFSDTTCKFSQQFALSVGVSGRTVPKNYKGIAENIDESLSLSKYPTCQWSTDSYTNWLTQNAVNIDKQQMNIGFTGVKAATNFIGNLANLQIGSALMGAVDSAQTLSNQIMDLQGSFYQARLLPNQVGGTAQGDVNFSSGDTTFKYLNMRCKNEYMRMIDDYFTKFGYKILSIKQPNYNSRKYWNYMQIGAGEIFAMGQIPQTDLEIINRIAQNGVTVWHDHNIIGNYELDNSII